MIQDIFINSMILEANFWDGFGATEVKDEPMVYSVKIGW
jgi:hypothetical protein